MRYSSVASIPSWEAPRVSPLIRRLFFIIEIFVRFNCAFSLIRVPYLSACKGTKYILLLQIYTPKRHVFNTSNETKEKFKWGWSEVRVRLNPPISLATILFYKGFPVLKVRLTLKIVKFIKYSRSFYQERAFATSKISLIYD